MLQMFGVSALTCICYGGLLFHVWLVAAAQFNPHEDSNCRVSAAHNSEEKFKQTT